MRIGRLASDALLGLQLLLERVGGVHSRLVWRRYDLAYAGSPSDVFIVTYPRSGTTLVQMLLYQLMTDGSMEMPHLARFSPFLERDLLKEFLSRRITIDALPAPHVIKSHLAYSAIPKGPGKYIYVMRSGLDVAVSLYFQKVRTGYRQTFEEFFRHFFIAARDRVSWFDHVSGWLENSRHLDVLYVTYEDLRTDFPQAAARIARFCGLAIEPGDWPRVARNCSFEHMRQHEEKLDGAMAWSGDPEDLHFVRRGRIGDWRSVVPPDLASRFQLECDRRFEGVPMAAVLRGESSKAEDVNARY